MNHDDEIDAIARRMTATTERRVLRDRVVARLETRHSHGHRARRFAPVAVAVASAAVVIAVVGLSLRETSNPRVGPSSVAHDAREMTAPVAPPIAEARTAPPTTHPATFEALPDALDLRRSPVTAPDEPGAEPAVAAMAMLPGDEESATPDVWILPPLAAAPPIVMSDISDAALEIAPLAETSISIAPLVVEPITIAAQYENESPPFLKGL